MTGPARPQETHEEERAQVQVVVSFPLTTKKPYKASLRPEDGAETVRTSAMRYFGVTDDQTFTYYLTLKGHRVDPNETIGSLAGHKHELKCTLAKELFQG